jgi:hypothetical protein
MRRTGFRIALPRRGRPGTRLGVALAVLGLCLRLAWLGPPVPVSADLTELAAFGEHALCLASPASTDRAPIPGDGLPPPAGDHDDHDHSLCCLWHASAGFVVPQVAAVARIAFAEAMSTVATTPEFQPPNLTGPTRARGPPGQA